MRRAAAPARRVRAPFPARAAEARPFGDERPGGQARRGQEAQAHRPFECDRTAERLAELARDGGAVLRPVDEGRRDERGRQRNHDTGGDDGQDFAQGPSFDSGPSLAQFMACRWPHSRAESGRATASSERRSAATPQRSMAIAAPIMQAAPNR